MRRLVLPCLLAVVLTLLGLTIAARPAAATDEYRRVLDQPCISCHVNGISADLNARGQAFAAVADHKTDPKAAWAVAVQAVPLQPATGAGASVLVPITVLALLLAWAYTMLRRRRSPT